MIFLFFINRSYADIKRIKYTDLTCATQEIFAQLFTCVTNSQVKMHNISSAPSNLFQASSQPRAEATAI